jgi:hypothetical protein
VPAPRDTVPKIVVKGLEPVVVKEDVRATPAKMIKRPAVSKKRNATQDSYRRSWPEELDLDSIELTIIVSEVEMQITQNLD